MKKRLIGIMAFILSLFLILVYSPFKIEATLIIGAIIAASSMVFFIISLNKKEEKKGGQFFSW
jgi:uncharacterized membrane protein (DUF373 family)